MIQWKSIYFSVLLKYMILCIPENQLNILKHTSLELIWQQSYNTNYIYNITTGLQLALTFELQDSLNESTFRFFFRLFFTVSSLKSYRISLENKDFRRCSKVSLQQCIHYKNSLKNRLIWIDYSNWISIFLLFYKSLCSMHSLCSLLLVW